MVILITMSRLPLSHVCLLALISCFAFLPAQADSAAVTVTISRKAPIETLSPTGDVNGVIEAMVGAHYTLVSVQGSQVMLQDAQGAHYLIAVNCTDYVPPVAPASIAAPADNAPKAPAPPAVTKAAPAPAPAPTESEPASTDKPLMVHVGGREGNDVVAVWPPGGMADRPLLVAAHGHGGSGPGEIGGWLSLAREHRFTVVCPTFRAVTLTSNLMQDAPYFDNCIRWIQANLQYDPHNVYMTGFSGGGLATWCLGTTKPDFFRGLFLQSGNFVSADYVPDIARWRDKPIKVIWGSNDLGRIINQSKQAVEMLKANHCNYTTEVVLGAHHQPHRDMVVAWVEQVMAPAATSSSSTDLSPSDDSN